MGLLPKECGYNGVRMVKDHKLYARFCAAEDEIRDIAEFLMGSCTDLHPSIIEADRFSEVSHTIQELRKEVDKWRSKGM